MLLFIVLFIANYYGKLPCNYLSVKDISRVHIQEKDSVEEFITDDNRFKTVQGINNAYAINLDRSKKRWDHLIKQCENNNIRIMRHKAFDGSKLKDDVLNIARKNREECKRKDPRAFCKWNMIKGELGVYFSHCEIWKKFRDSTDNIIMILEDDIDFGESFVNRLDIAMKELPSDWDMLLVGHRIHHTKNICKNDKQHYCILPFSKHLDRVKTTWYGLHGYIINRNSLEKMLESCDMKNIKRPIDVEVADFAKTMNIYSTKNELITSYSHLPTKDKVDQSQIMNKLNIIPK